MAKNEKKPEVTQSIPPVVAGKLYGLVRDPVTRFGYEFFFIVTAVIDEEGQIVSVTKTDQSWFMWEALHKMERQTELSLIELQKNKDEVPK